MSSLVQSVRGRIPPDCETTECKDHDCSASLEGMEEEWLLLSLDCADLGLLTERRADFVLVTDGRMVSCVELKSGTLKGAADQLQASADYIDERLLSDEVNLRFLPVLVHRSEFSPVRVREWARRRITFRNKRFAISRIRCGESLYRAVRHIA